MRITKKDKKALGGLAIGLIAAYAEDYLDKKSKEERDELKQFGVTAGKIIAQDAKNKPGDYYNRATEIYDEYFGDKQKTRRK